MKRGFLALSVLLLGMALGGFFTLNSWDGKVFFYPFSEEGGDHRELAAIESKLDISQFKGVHFKSASIRRLLLGAKTIQKGDQQSIALGHFIRINALGKKEFACDFYRFIKLKFHGDGLSVSGAPVEMHIVIPCQYNRNSEMIKEVLLPNKKELKKADLRVPVLLGEQSTLTMKNFYGFWPKRWVLYSLKMVRAPSSRDNLVLKKKEINKVLKGHFTLFW